MSASPASVIARLRRVRLRLDRFGISPGPERFALIGAVQADLDAIESGLVTARDQRPARRPATTADRLDDYRGDLELMRDTGLALGREGAELAWSLRALDDLIADVAAESRRLGPATGPRAAAAARV